MIRTLIQISSCWHQSFKSITHQNIMDYVDADDEAAAKTRFSHQPYCNPHHRQPPRLGALPPSSGHLLDEIIDAITGTDRRLWRFRPPSFPPRYPDLQSRAANSSGSHIKPCLTTVPNPQISCSPVDNSFSGRVWHHYLCLPRGASSTRRITVQDPTVPKLSTKQIRPSRHTGAFLHEECHTLPP